jgi:hypothetical protein
VLVEQLDLTLVDHPTNWCTTRPTPQLREGQSTTPCHPLPHVLHHGVAN